MLDLTSTPDDLLLPIDRVLAAASATSPGLRADQVMVVGAACRDILHHACGHTFSTNATHDLDLGLALSSWDTYSNLARAFPKIGDTGIRFWIADVTVDLVPFGDIEDPTGTAQPPTRAEPFSVWAFDEIFATALPLTLPSGPEVRIPTVAGYTAAKMGAWLDRSEWHEAKDAADLALVAYWYEQSIEVDHRLYETEFGNEVLIANDADVSRAAAHLLGVDVAATIGPRRLEELLQRWPGNIDLLVREFTIAPTPFPNLERRRRTLAAVAQGFRHSASIHGG